MDVLRVLHTRAQEIPDHLLYPIDELFEVLLKVMDHEVLSNFLVVVPEGQPLLHDKVDEPIPPKVGVLPSE